MDGLSRLIQDPLFVLNLQGILLDCNRPAKALLGPGTTVGKRVFETDEGFRALIEVASGTSEPMIGAVAYRHPAGEIQRFRVRAVTIDRSESGLRFGVQILDTRDDQFAFLSRRVSELNAEVAERRAVQARLEESLAQNEILYKELQHRVKNHLQMTLGLVSAARREASSAGELSIVQGIEAKLQIVFGAQRLMYVQDSKGVPAHELLGSVTAVTTALVPAGIRIEVHADPVTISNEVAFPVALIINELLSNAVKYGAPGGAGRISASLRSVGEEIELAIRDWGPGFVKTETDRRSSGLGLVRGLCRQIGGKIEIASDPGTSVRISFPKGV